MWISRDFVTWGEKVNRIQNSSLKRMKLSYIIVNNTHTLGPALWIQFYTIGDKYQTYTFTVRHSRIENNNVKHTLRNNLKTWWEQNMNKQINWYKWIIPCSMPLIHVVYVYISMQTQHNYLIAMFAYWYVRIFYISNSDTTMFAMHHHCSHWVVKRDLDK